MEDARAMRVGPRLQRRTVCRMGRREQSLFAALLRSGYWARRCGWNYSTEGETCRMLQRLAEKGYVDIQQPGPLFVPTDKGRRVWGLCRPHSPDKEST